MIEKDRRVTPIERPYMLDNDLRRRLKVNNKKKKDDEEEKDFKSIIKRKYQERDGQRN